MSFCLSPEGDDAMPVLKPDRAHGLQARRGEGHELIEEDTAVRVASAFRHELKATPRPPRVWYYDTTHERQSRLRFGQDDDLSQIGIVARNQRQCCPFRGREVVRLTLLCFFRSALAIWFGVIAQSVLMLSRP